MSHKKRRRKHEHKVAKAVERMRHQQKAAPTPKVDDTPKEVPEIKDNTGLFERRSAGNISKEIAEWDQRKERLKAGRLHTAFRDELVKAGKTGKEVFDALDGFKETLKAEIKDKTVLSEALATVDVMKKRLVVVLSIPKKPERPEAN